MFELLFHYLLLILFTNINTNDLGYEVIKAKNSSNFKYVPLSVYIDFQIFDKYYFIYKNKTNIEILKKNINKAKNIIESLFSVNYQYHIITNKNYLKKLCKNIKLNNINISQLYKNLIIIPLLENKNSSTSDNVIDYHICNIYSDEDTKPIIATLNIPTKIFSLKEDEIFIDILHNYFHILGFRQDAKEKAGMRNFCIGKSFENVELKRVAKKYMGVYALEIALFNNQSKYLHFKNKIKYDIMSSKTSRSLNLNEYNLRYFQNLKWYRVNMNICGCSLNGECSFGILPYEIYINKDTSKLYCYRNEVFKEKCLVDNNIFFFNIKKYNDNKLDYKKSYFINNKCINYDITYDYNTNLLYKGLIDSEEGIIQKLYLISPKFNNNCKCHLKTIYLYNEFDNEYNEYVENNYKLKKIKINDKNKIVYSSFTNFNIKHSESFRKTLEYNNIFILNNEYTPNILFSILNADIAFELLSHVGKYTIFRDSRNLSILGVKNMAFNFYSIFNEKYPKDFDYLPKTYLMSKNKNVIENKFKDYIQKENDLWLCKPMGGSLGEGIYFLKNYEDFLNCSQLITKYIHNPHLYKNRKYHIRLYNFVSSIDPLIIYIYKEGQVMRASHDYKYSLKDISDRQVFLTNAHINYGKEGYNEDISLEELKIQIIKEGGDWDFIWDQIKDICIKTIITVYDEEYNKLKTFTNYNAKSFIFFGLDILIDENYKVWFLEANDTPHMELYDKVNEKNKIGISTDIFNILGIIPFDHSNNNPLEQKTCSFKNKIEEKLNNIFCEFERPKGKLERIFPIKETLSYYKQFFIKNYKENEELWKLL